MPTPVTGKANLQKAPLPNDDQFPQEATDPELVSLLQRYVDSFDSESVTVARTPYQGQLRTTTGIVKIMRQNGNVESAEFLEELRQMQETASQLLEQMRLLHKKRTGTYPQVIRRPVKQSLP